MEKSKKVILYCFIYEIKNNQMYRQEDEAELYKDDYFIHDEEYGTIYVQSYKIDKPQVAEHGNNDSPFIYMYSLQKDINRAMELIDKSLRESLDEAKKKFEQIQKMVNVFEEKQEYIKNKYSKEE